MGVDKDDKDEVDENTSFVILNMQHNHQSARTTVSVLSLCKREDVLGLHIRRRKLRDFKKDNYISSNKYLFR
jgi:hypothetical protein